MHKLGKSKSFFIEECQLINVEEMMKLENYHLAKIISNN